MLIYGLYVYLIVLHTCFYWADSPEVNVQDIVRYY